MSALPASPGRPEGPVAPMAAEARAQAPALAAAARPPDLAGLTDAGLLQLLWLASPALPVGGFSYSEGLESAIDDGLAADEAGVSRWLQDQLRLALGRADLTLAAQAHAAWQAADTERIVALNDWVRMSRETSELRQQTEQMGRSLRDWLGQRWPAHPALLQLAQLQPAPTWPVAFALAAWLTGAPLRASLLAHAFGWAENMVQASLKAVPLGQSAGQRVLGQLCALIPGVVDAALAGTDDSRQAFTPMLAIVSSRHEAQYSRLFRS